MRDNFKASTILTLAKRAGFRCSNPECAKATIGAAAGHQGIVSVGVAAHITAASPKGPRYDSTTTSDERSDPSNGIWLCQVCAKLVDADPFHFDAERLLAWKHSSESASFRALSGDGSAFERLLHDVGELLSKSSETARRLSPSLGSVLTLSAVRRADITKRRDSVGDVVQWGRLVDGVYAPRPEVLRRATEEYLAWIGNSGAVIRRRRLPVFWIDGRSGDGKSVLLFQLAESILSARPDTLIYQATRPDSLPVLIDHAHNTAVDGRLILIVAEDLHRVTDLDTFQAALKLTLDRDRFSVAVLACGPTPEKDAFLRVNRAVEVSAWTMTSLSALDLTLFSEWFDTLIEATDTLERTILVEVLFASQVGAPLAAFAKTFGQRLRTFGVFETVRNIVAINALDIGGPAALFGSAVEHDSIERLACADQLHFEWKEEGWGAGVRLVHGIIAWRLFEEWSADSLRGPSIELRFARTLSSILHIPQLPNEFCGQLMRSLRLRLDTLLERAPMDVSRSKQQILDELVKGTDDDSRARCFPVTAILAEYISSDQSLVNSAHINLAEQIVSDANAPTRNRTLIAAQLSILEFTGRIVSNAHRERAEALVLDPVVGADAAIALQMLVERAGSAPMLMERWLSDHPDVVATKSFLYAALDQIGGTSMVINACLDWVRANWDGQRGMEPLTLLLRMTNDKHAIEVAMRWVTENAEVAVAAEVLAALTRRNSNNDAVRELAIEWVTHHTNRPEALDVMSTLLQVQSKSLRAAIRPLVVMLVREHSEHPKVTNLLASASGAFLHDDQLSALTAEWLQSHRSKSHGAEVVSSLLNHNPDDEQITSIALDWIQSMSESSSTAHVLSSLLRTREHNESVQAVALEWIRKHADNKAVFSPLSALLRVAGDEASVRDTAYEWVTEHQDSTGASHVLSSLIKADPDDMKVRELATSWATSNTLNKITGQLLSTLLRVSVGEPTIRQLALDWLSVHERRVEAAQLLGTLLFVTNGEPEIQLLATRWVTENAHRRAEQQPLLAALIGTSELKEEWINLSLRLLGTPRLEGEISSLFEALAIAAPSSPAVEAVLLQFLKNPRNGVRGRQDVLEAWIASGGSTGPAIGVLSALFLTRDRRSHDGMQFFGIMARACARTWEAVLQAVVEDPSQARSLCYLVGCGIPSIRLDVEEFMLSIKKWPSEELCYVLKGLIESEARAEVFIDVLCEWLLKNWRLTGYGMVLRAIANRTTTEVTFALRLPRDVYADLRARTR